MRVAKKVFFDLPGFGRVHAMPGATLDPGGYNKTKKLSDAGVVGHTEEVAVPKLSLKIAKTRGLSQRALSDFEGDVTAIVDDGATYLYRNCILTSPAALSDGDFSVEMEADSVEEIG